ncbi:MAG: 23S rRNA (guanosine(2251)-2'-O)-methyltransferase RlmB [Elusimicrobia bacterium RIFOXYD2_FULL_34_15]|nr:MAG: 23S rRNA (guanosine(2251)-2'-O)-methyltransferase RlmB [Elusimicrobia bacterium RIFOXYD2_FULL_34_15]
MNTEIIYGRHPIFEALSAGRRKFKKLFVSKHYEGEIVDKIIALARKRNVPVQFVDSHKLTAYSPNNQGTVAFVSPKEYLPFEQLLHLVNEKENAKVCILDEIEDPQNLGTIIRSAVCFGIDAIIVLQRSSAGISTGTSKASAGAIEHIPIVRVANIVYAIETLKKNGFWTYGADMSGENISGKEIKGKIAVVIGNEGSGLKRLTKEKCDFLVKIPITPRISSLNAGMSASIIFYEIIRQQGLDLAK